MKNDNDIKSLLIVDDADYSKQMAEEFAKSIIKYVKISKNGDVIFIDKSLSQDDKLKLALTVRFIAHTFDNAIPETITLKELSILLSERVESIGSRVSKIIKSENFAKKIAKGVYTAQYFVIEKYIADLDSKIHSPASSSTKTIKKGSPRKDKNVTGVGKDILELLINNDFFKTPKTMKEISEKLEEETKFHNPKVIDMTIRKTFVNSKRILKRIPNANKGKAKWLYVIR